MSVKKDRHMLSKSETKNISDMAEAIRLDLTLDHSPYYNTGSVIGKVRDSLGNPIYDAAIIVFDENFNIIANTVTASDGSFIIPLLKADSNYFAYAQAPKSEMSVQYSFSIKKNETAELDIFLDTKSNTYTSVIIGGIINTEGMPINSASIELYRVDETSTQLMHISFPDQVGQFIIRDLDSGSYFLKINAPGYFTDFFPAEIKQPDSILHIEATLKKNANAPRGTVTGVITDNLGQPIPNADVILYKIEDDKRIPVAYTKTNHEGVYLFINIPNGKYSVNSIRSVVIK
jgi:5-hydroxyisourate hydrolase-like protein (transthyretin family)